MDDIKEAAQRMREFNSQVDRYAPLREDVSIESDYLFTLANAYLAEHPEDEDELATGEWFKSLQVVAPSSAMFMFGQSSDVKPHVLLVGVSNPTRGQVLRLLAIMQEVSNGPT